jgi:hypothetical protein
MNRCVAVAVLLLALLSPTEAGKQRETEAPTPPVPTIFPTFAPTISSSNLPSPFPVPASTGPTVTLTNAPTISSADDPSAVRTYTLEMPEMTLAFGLPPQTSLAPTRLAEDWQAFLTRVLQVALGVTVQGWDSWDSDVTYTTLTGNGFAVASGTVRLEQDGRRRRLVELTQTQLAEELSDYFLIWGVDDMWEFMISRGYPMTSIVLQVDDQNLSPRRASPEQLEDLLRQEDGGDDKRNAWIAGVVCSVLVLVVAAAVAFLYLQRQGQQQSEKAWGASSSPRTQTSEEPPSPRVPLPPPSAVSSDIEVVLQEKGQVVVQDAPSGDASSAPGWSESMLESSFLYDAARLDQVIDSAREYELPYPVANVPFSDLTGTSAVKDAAQLYKKREEEESEEEEDLLILAAEEGAFGNSVDELIDSMEQDAVTNKKSERVASPIDLNYSRSLFDDDDEKKEAESPVNV